MLRLVLVLLLSLSSGNGDSRLMCTMDDGNSRSCGLSLLKACYSVSHKPTPADADAVVARNCEDLTEDGLDCLRSEGAKAGFTHSGNCVTFTGKWEAFHKIVKQCKANKPTGIDGTLESTFTYCTCNDPNECNKDCKCDPSYGLCGAEPCESKTRPTSPPTGTSAPSPLPPTGPPTSPMPHTSPATPDRASTISTGGVLALALVTLMMILSD